MSSLSLWKNIKHAFDVWFLCCFISTTSWIVWIFMLILYPYDLGACCIGAVAIMRLPLCQWNNLNGNDNIKKYLPTYKEKTSRTIRKFLAVYNMYFVGINTSKHPHTLLFNSLLLLRVRVFFSKMVLIHSPTAALVKSSMLRYLISFWLCCKWTRGSVWSGCHSSPGT